MPSATLTLFSLGLFTVAAHPVATPGDIFRTPSAWAVLARKPTDFGSIPFMSGWREARLSPGGQPWTDDYSNIFTALIR